MMLVVMMSMSAFADVTITKEWEDGLTGTAASNRAAPTVNLEGTTPYEQLLNLMYPVGSVYLSMDMSFNPNVAWGGTWSKVETGRFLEATSGAEVGTKTEAGLPNITGGFAPWSEGSGASITQPQGAFYTVGSNQYGWGTATGRDQDNEYIYFNASRSNSIYGNSTTVQPASIKVVMWKRTA